MLWKDFAQKRQRPQRSRFAVLKYLVWLNLCRQMAPQMPLALVKPRSPEGNSHKRNYLSWQVSINHFRLLIICESSILLYDGIMLLRGWSWSWLPIYYIWEDKGLRAAVFPQHRFESRMQKHSNYCLRHRAKQMTASDNQWGLGTTETQTPENWKVDVGTCGGRPAVPANVAEWADNLLLRVFVFNHILQ